MFGKQEQFIAVNGYELLQDNGDGTGYIVVHVTSAVTKQPAQLVFDLAEHAVFE